MFGNHFKIDDDRPVWDISSLDENKIISIFNKNKGSIIEWHKINFSRIYPSGLRVGSSNYNPYPGFIAGSQIVALNI